MKSSTVIGQHGCVVVWGWVFEDSNCRVDKFCPSSKNCIWSSRKVTLFLRCVRQVLIKWLAMTLPHLLQRELDMTRHFSKFVLQNTEASKEMLVISKRTQYSLSNDQIWFSFPEKISSLPVIFCHIFYHSCSLYTMISRDHDVAFLSMSCFW